ncbi:MAG: SIS domain-containing protein [Planctomycetota bacterium]
MALRAEILSQPHVLAEQLERTLPQVRRIASELRRATFDFVFLVARGSSDNAGLYAKYLWGAHNGLPVALAAPSLFTHYQRPPRVARALVVGISQSGQSPDLVHVMTQCRAQGAVTVAIVNDAGSPLAHAAQHVIELGVGAELAVAASKTYTAQLFAVAMLSVAFEGAATRERELNQVPGFVEQTIALEPLLAQAAERYRAIEQCVVLGRGFNFASAYEWSLKLKELCYVLAAAYSAADFLHGPIAVVARGFPIFAVVPDGAVRRELVDLLTRLRDEQFAELVVVSNDDAALALGHTQIPLPVALPEWLSPIVSIVPAQLFTYYLARAKGLDPDQPRGLEKVTRSW